MDSITAISDFHGNLPPYIPPCDILLLGGDYAPSANPVMQKAFFSGTFSHWLLRQKARYIIGIAGNHDFALEDTDFAKSLPWYYLQDASVKVDGLKIWGNPWTPIFANWAFMKTENEIADKLMYMPEDVDIILSHGPAYDHLDRTNSGVRCGSSALLYAIETRNPKAVICGHIHEAQGYKETPKTRFYNVAYCNTRNAPVYNPTKIELE